MTLNRITKTLTVFFSLNFSNHILIYTHEEAFHPRRSKSFLY